MNLIKTAIAEAINHLEKDELPQAVPFLSIALTMLVERIEDNSFNKIEVIAARKGKYCRICRRKTEGHSQLTLNYGEEYAHTSCLEKE